MNTNSLVQVDEKFVLAILVSGWLVYRVVRNLAARRVNLPREALLTLAFLYGCLVFHVTFFPMNIVLYSFDPYDSNLAPLVGALRMLQHGSPIAAAYNLAGNLVLLLPLGFLLAVFFKPLRIVWKVLAVGFLVSLGIEITQLLLKVRIFDVDDLIFNTVSVLIGYAMFLLADKLPLLSRLFERIAASSRKRQWIGMTAYGLFALAAFLSIYSYQIIRQTETEAQIVRALPAMGQADMGTPKFGEFMFVVSQTEQGDKAYAIYRRVFFNRYTLFEWGDLKLDENIFSVSGMSTGHTMNYFVIARSAAKVDVMVSEAASFPVKSIGGYYFSYARFPLDQSERYFSFHFLDEQKNDLGLTMQQ